MSRPKPKILIEKLDNTTDKTLQILEAESIWAVFYKNKPFNLRAVSYFINYPGPKYKKVSFSNPGHAYNLAEKLNKLFETNDFSVVNLTELQAK